MTAEEMAAKILEYVKSRGDVTFVELMNSALRLPIATARGVKRGYKKPHWMPTIYNYRSEHR
jgi:hypothetical protein